MVSLSKVRPGREAMRGSADDHAAARELADAAGALLLEIRGALGAGADPHEVRSDGDRRSNALLLELLRQRFPADGILTEEAPDTLRQDGAKRVWIVDPLDGTREFGEEGRNDWAVHVALVEDGSLSAGAVALPACGTTYATDELRDAPTGESRRPRIAVSRTRPAAEAVAVAQRLEGELVPMGSAGAKAMAVVAGDIDIYLHSGGQYVWDSAAPVAVAAAAGLHTSRLDGSPLVYGAASTWLPDVLICRQELRDRVLDALAAERSL
jgi:3'(2'), 5'-bisphosphate nucleotidase